MTTGTQDQLTALQRIGTFSAAVRGHQLGEWRTAQRVTQASCTRCGAGVRAYFPALQPEIEGAAIDQECDSRAVAERAA